MNCWRLFFFALFLTGQSAQVFGAAELVNKDWTGRFAVGGVSDQFLLSADGRLVVFQSSGTNHAINDTNRLRDVFVYDRVLGSNVWDTTGSRWPGAQPMSYEGSIPGSLTPDSRYLAFRSSATSFVSGVEYPSVIEHFGQGGSILYTSVVGQVYVQDLWSNVTTLASVSPDGLTAGQASSGTPRLSMDGRFVAFLSSATNLAALQDRNSGSDVLLRDLVSGTTEILTLNPAGGILDSGTTGFRMSTNGRYFCFETAATNVVAGRSNRSGSPLVYWRDRLAGTNALVSDTLNGILLSYGSANLGDMSPDGRYVSFSTWMTNMVAGVIDTNGNSDTFIRDMQTGEIWMVTVTTNNYAAQGYGMGFTGDGRRLLFYCSTTAVVPGVADGNGYFFDWFLHDVVARTNAIITMSLNDNTSMAQSDVRWMRVSDDGRFAAFMSDATNLTAGVTNRSSRPYVRDMQANRTLKVLRLPSGEPGLGYSDANLSIDISADGRAVAFLSFTNLDQSIIDTNGNWNLFAAPVYPPQFTSSAVPPAAMSADGISGATYVLQRSTNLMHWTPVGTNTANAQGVFVTSDPTPASGPTHYYRLREQ